MKTYIANIIEFANKPFPEDESYWAYWKILIALSLFVCFFLFVFQPFGLASIESNRFLVCLGFGSMTLVGALVYEISVARILYLLGFYKNWTFIKWVGTNLVIMLFISLANFLFARLVLIGYIDWQFFPQMIYSTLMIGIMPMTILGGYKMSKEEKKNQAIAETILPERWKISDNSRNESQLFEIPFGQIRYVEALQNYIKIGYVNEQSQLKERTERATMKHVIQQVENSSIVQSHRSYLVNKTSIEKVEGNAQGLLLSLKDCEKLIPVSRSRISLFK
ncbi:MAG: hypothetical protein Sapg2KO_38510 [Saprospiraceae bacterium]